MHRSRIAICLVMALTSVFACAGQDDGSEVDSLDLIFHEQKDYYVVSLVNAGRRTVCVQPLRYGENVWYEVRDNEGNFHEDPNPPASYSDSLTSFPLRRSSTSGVVVWKDTFLPASFDSMKLRMRFRYFAQRSPEADGPCVIHQDIDIASEVGD